MISDGALVIGEAHKNIPFDIKEFTILRIYLIQRPFAAYTLTRNWNNIFFASVVPSDYIWMMGR
jgi:hypothetical protein